MLTDARNEYAHALGIRFELPDYLVEVYKQFGLDLPTFHADDCWTLPMPARLVVDQSGTVRLAAASPDYTRRPEPQETLELLRDIVT